MESTIRGSTPPPTRASGKDADALGPSDSSDSGSDIQGERPMATRPDNENELGATVADLASDSDASGTGERASADGDDPLDGEDIMPDRIIDGPNASNDPTKRQKSYEAAELTVDDDSIDDEDEDLLEDEQENESTDPARAR